MAYKDTLTLREELVDKEVPVSEKRELKSLRKLLKASLASSKKLLKSVHEFSRHFGGLSKKDIDFMEGIFGINHKELLDQNDALKKQVEDEIIYRENQIDEITRKICEI